MTKIETKNMKLFEKRKKVQNKNLDICHIIRYIL